MNPVLLNFCSETFQGNVSIMKIMSIKMLCVVGTGFVLHLNIQQSAA